MIKHAVTFLTAVFLSFPVAADLLVNGSFEDEDVANNSWKAFSPDQVDGWDGSWVEVWDGLFGRVAADGEQFAELNSINKGNHSPFTQYQSVGVEAGGLYNVNFAYQARQNKNEAFTFSLLDSTGDAFFSQDIIHSDTSTWTRFDYDFSAPDELITVSFSSITTGTLGNLIDDVSLSRPNDNISTDVAGPGSAVIALLPIAYCFYRITTKNTSTVRTKKPA